MKTDGTYNPLELPFASHDLKIVEIKCEEVNGRVHKILSSLSTYGIPLNRIKIQQTNRSSGSGCKSNSWYSMLVLCIFSISKQKENIKTNYKNVNVRKCVWQKDRWMHNHFMSLLPVGIYLVSSNCSSASTLETKHQYRWLLSFDSF